MTSLLERFGVLRARLRDGAFLVGTWLTFADPGVAELLGQSAVDFVVVDTEHSPIGPAELPVLVLAVQHGGASALVRVSKNDRTLIAQALDAGADGVLVPQISGADDARAAVDAARYPPAGTRGYGPLRASRFGRAAEAYVERAADVAVIVQIERLDALESIADIVDVPGLDGLFVGPNDLAGALGVFGRPTHPDVIAAAERVAGAAGERSLAVGMATGTDPDHARDWRARGCSFVTVGSDYVFLAGAVDAALAGLHEEP